MSFNFNKGIFSAALFAFVQAATAQNSNLVIFSQDAHKFYVIINGVQQNNVAQTNVKITNFEQNMAKVKVVFENNSLNTIDKTVYFNEPNNEWVYNVKSKKGKLVMNMMTYRKLSVNAEPNQYVHIYGQPVPAATTTTTTVQTVETTTNTTQNPNGNANVAINVSETTTNPNNTNLDNSNVSLNMGINDGMGGANVGINISITDVNGDGIADEQGNTNQNPNGNVNVNISGNGQPTTTNNNGRVTTTTTTTTTSTATTTVPETRPAVTNNCFNPMSNADFEKLKTTVKGKSFESDQLTIAKQGCKNGCMSAVQIAGVMKVMKFESTRLDFAQYAYPFCTDKNNYYQVNDAFEHSMSIEELEEALNLGK